MDREKAPVTVVMYAAIPLGGFGWLRAKYVQEDPSVCFSTFKPVSMARKAQLHTRGNLRDSSCPWIRENRMSWSKYHSHIDNICLL